jgi:SRSO17 transposase
MGSRLSAPGPQERRFAAYMDGLAQAAGHADRIDPLKSYCKGLLLPGERKSVEPMAARLAPWNVRQTHQSLHHLVADAGWSDEELLAEVRHQVLPALQKNGPVVAWIVDDTGFPKKGKHSVGVARQYCGQLGKQENCQVAVSLSIATWNASLPMAYRLYLPEEWAQDSERREKAGVPEEIPFQTKPQIALDQIRQAVEAEVAHGVVLADAAYGNHGPFRAGLSKLGLEYMVGVQSSMTVWEPGAEPVPAKPRKGAGRPPRVPGQDRGPRPVTVKERAQALPASAWKEVTWREGTGRRLRSRFAAVRVRPAHREAGKTEPPAEEWLLVEWPRGKAEPVKYWVSTLPPQTKRKDLVQLAKHRWIVERDYQELKQELGLGHLEGRGWRGFHHRATLCIAAYGFLVAERNRFSPSARVGNLRLSAPEPPPGLRPCGSPPPPRAASSALPRHDPKDDGTFSAGSACSLPVLWVVSWLSIGVEINVPFGKRVAWQWLVTADEVGEE